MNVVLCVTDQMISFHKEDHLTGIIFPNSTININIYLTFQVFYIVFPFHSRQNVIHTASLKFQMRPNTIISIEFQCASIVSSNVYRKCMIEHFDVSIETQEW